MLSRTEKWSNSHTYQEVIPTAFDLENSLNTHALFVNDVRVLECPWLSVNVKIKRIVLSGLLNMIILKLFILLFFTFDT